MKIAIPMPSWYTPCCAATTPVFEAIAPASIAAYRPPPFLAARVGGGPLRWRVRALDAADREVARSAWRTITLPSS